MTTAISIITGKSFSFLSKTLNLGNGSTWPGHLALKFNKHFVEEILKNSTLKIILVAGTNGKTTTSLLIKTILEKNGKKVIHNGSGANLLNGIASALLLETTFQGKLTADYAIFEVDENALPLVLKEIDPHYVILLNLFRDQLDRYGEVAAIARKWTEALLKEPHIKLILNADDPQVAYIGQRLFNHKHVTYFGLQQKGEKEFEHAVDSIYCPRCNHKLDYQTIYYSHLGDWSCPHCGLKRPQLALDAVSYMPLMGLYNAYNTLAAVLTTNVLGISEKEAQSALQGFKPAFGRQEIIDYHNKKIQIFLSKNPTGFNQSIKTIQELGAKHVLLALNDRIADGQDVSWIWDIDTELLLNFAENLIITGDRAYDMGLRIKYSQLPRDIYQIEPHGQMAIKKALDKLSAGETLFVLPTYTAMLEIRKALIGKEIL